MMTRTSEDEKLLSVHGIELNPGVAFREVSFVDLLQVIVLPCAKVKDAAVGET